MSTLRTSSSIVIVVPSSQSPGQFGVVAVSTGVELAVAVALAVDEGFAVTPGVAVFVAVEVWIGIVGLFVGAPVAVGVDVSGAVAVLVAVDVWMGVVGLFVGTVLAVGVDGTVAVAVASAVSVRVAVAVFVRVAVGVAVRVAVGVGEATDTSAAPQRGCEAPATNRMGVSSPHVSGVSSAGAGDVQTPSFSYHASARPSGDHVGPLKAPLGPEPSHVSTGLVGKSLTA